jgi:DNA-binding PadR family transcriptional regulator
VSTDSPSPLSLQILLSVAERPRYGYEMMREIEWQTQGAMVPKSGSLYTALQRLEQQGLITPDQAAKTAEESERRLYYRLTDEGRMVLTEEIARLERFVRIAERKRLRNALGAEGA